MLYPSSTDQVLQLSDAASPSPSLALPLPFPPSLSRPRSGFQRFSDIFREFEMVIGSFQQFSASDLVFKGFQAFSEVLRWFSEVLWLFA